MRRFAPALLIVLILGASACSSAPAKDVPPIADEIDTVIPVEKPASPEEEDEYEEEEEPAEPETASFDCDTATLVSVAPVKDSEPASVTIDDATYVVDWTGDLNADGADDLVLKHECASGVCDYLGLVKCDGGHAQVLELGATTKVVVTTSDTGWATIAVHETDDAETATIRKMSWGESGYADE